VSIIMKLSVWTSIAVSSILLSRIHAFSSSRSTIGCATTPHHHGRTTGFTTTRGTAGPAVARRPTTRPRPCPLAAAARNNGEQQQPQFLSNAELSRPLRRDVFNYDAWVEHRSPDRFNIETNLIGAPFRSIILRHLLPDTANLAGFATILCIYNGLFVLGYDDWQSLHHPPLLDGTGLTFPIVRLPSIVFGLTTPFLALLLGTNEQTNIEMCVLIVHSFDLYI
jgi:hypothetical protein